MKIARYVIATLAFLGIGMLAGCSTGASVNTPILDVGAGASVDG